MIKKYIYSIITFFLSIIFFSSNSTNIDSTLSFPIRSKYYISSTYGYRTLGTYHFHNGIDVAKPPGTPVYSLSNGVINHIGFSSSYGHYITITYTNGYKSLYGHMSGIYPFSIGDFVTANDIVAYIGPTRLKSGIRNGFTTRTTPPFYYL